MFRNSPPSYKNVHCGFFGSELKQARPVQPGEGAVPTPKSPPISPGKPKSNMGNVRR